MNSKGFLPALVLTVLMFFSALVMATAQAPDSIIIDGKTESLNTNPLDGYLRAHPSALPQSDYASSGNWRGYVATWEVHGGKLLLRRIDITFKNTTGGPDDPPLVKNVIADVFPGGGDTVATWYSGTLIVPTGKMVDYVHMGYGSTFERYKLITVNEGMVVKSLDLKLDQFKEYRDAQFKAFKRTKEYAEKYKSIAARDPADRMDDEQIEAFLYSFESERYLSIDFSKQAK